MTAWMILICWTIPSHGMYKEGGMVMKKKFTFMAIALGAAAIFSCQKENTIKDDPSQEQEFVKITCSLPSDPDTKVTLTKEGGVGKVAWEIGDEILVHGEFVSPSTETIYSYVAEVESISADKKTATFSIPASIVKYPDRTAKGYVANLFAAYPASALKVFTSKETWYYHNVFENTNTFLMAGCNDSRSEANTYKIEFVPLCGAISFKVNGDFDQYIFSGKNDEVVGYDRFVARVDRKTESGLYKVIPYTSTDLDPIGGATQGEKTKISVTTGFVHDGSKDNYVYFPNGANFTGGFKIQFLKGGVVVKEASTSSARNVAKGKYLALGDITSHLKDPEIDDTKTTLIDGLDFASATNLSATATANCYVVDAAGQYKFKMVKGNGSASVGAVKGASIVWETYNDAGPVTAKSVIAAVDYYINGDDKYVVFKTPDVLKPGNALLAVKDISDNILWSWHIWIPETAITTVDATGTIGGVVMDRNLGALVVAVDGETEVNPLSFGLFYQWGRKDPFPGAKARNAKAAAVSGASTVFYEGTIELAEAISNPTKYASQNEKDWITETNNDLWKAGEKTIYDPCPPGYRVADYNSEKDFWKNGSGTSWATTCGGTQNTTYSWYTIGTGANKVVFPFAGYIDDNGGSYSHTYDRSVIWASKNSSSSRGYCRDLRGDDASRYTTYKSRGGSVRCVVE